jgi:hypothetical protein
MVHVETQLPAEGTQPAIEPGAGQCSSGRSCLKRGCWDGGHDSGLTAPGVLVSCFRDACFVFCCTKYTQRCNSCFLGTCSTHTRCHMQAHACLLLQRDEGNTAHARTRARARTHTHTHTRKRAQTRTCAVHKACARTHRYACMHLQDHVHAHTLMPLSFHPLIRARSQGRRGAARPGNLENRKEDPCSSS